MSIRGALLAFTLILASTAVNAADRTLVSGNGTKVTLAWSDAWVEAIDASTPPNTVTFRTKADPTALMVLVTAVFDPNTNLSDDAAMREIMNRTAQMLQPQAVESKLEAKPLEGGKRRGYWLLATDKAPKPGEYKFFQSVVMAADRGVVIATILFNDNGAQEAAAAKKAVSNLELVMP